MRSRPRLPLGHHHPLRNIPSTAFSHNEDFAALNMYYTWITRVHHNKHYTWKSLATRDTRLTKNKMERRNQEGFGEYGTCLGLRAGSVNSSQQTRMASACGTIHPPICRMNKGPTHTAAAS